MDVETTNRDDDLHFANSNTARLTCKDIDRIHKWLEERNDKRKIETIEANELNKLLCEYFMRIKKTDGREFDPRTLDYIIASIRRYLKSKSYSHNIALDPAFRSLHETIRRKKRELFGKAYPLSKEEEDWLWNSGTFGDHSPEALRNAVWYFTSKCLGNSHDRQMCLGDVKIKSDPRGRRFVEIHDRTTTAQGRRNLPKVHQLWKNSENSKRCPVRLFEQYMFHRPYEMRYSDDSLFYLGVNNRRCKGSDRWYAQFPMGVLAWKNTIDICSLSGTNMNLSTQRNSSTNLVNAGLPITTLAWVPTAVSSANPSQKGQVLPTKKLRVEPANVTLGHENKTIVLPNQQQSTTSGAAVNRTIFVLQNLPPGNGVSTAVPAPIQSVQQQPKAAKSGKKSRRRILPNGPTAASLHPIKPAVKQAESKYVITNHSTVFCGLLWSNHQKGYFHDAYIVTAGRQVISAHRIVLSCWSPFLCSIFSANPDVKFVLLEDFSENDLKVVIEAMYTGELKICVENCEALLALVQKLQIEIMSLVCKHFCENQKSQTASTVTDSKQNTPEMCAVTVKQENLEQWKSSVYSPKTATSINNTSSPSPLLITPITQSSDNTSLVFSHLDSVQSVSSPLDDRQIGLSTRDALPLGHSHLNSQPDEQCPFDGMLESCSSIDNTPVPYSPLEDKQLSSSPFDGAQLGISSEDDPPTSNLHINNVQCKLEPTSPPPSDDLTMQIKQEPDSNHQDSDFICQFCGKHFTFYSILKLHLRKHDLPFQRTKTTSHLIKKFKDGDFRYKCKLCKQRFRLKATLLKHCQNVHFKKAECRDCSKKFLSFKTLQDHRYKTHPRRWRGESCVCLQCCRVFRHQANAHKHIPCTTTITPSSVCQHCSQKFRHLRFLQTHKAKCLFRNSERAVDLRPTNCRSASKSDQACSLEEAMDAAYSQKSMSVSNITHLKLSNEDVLFEKNLLGDITPYQLLRTMIYMVDTYFTKLDKTEDIYRDQIRIELDDAGSYVCYYSATLTKEQCLEFGCRSGVKLYANKLNPKQCYVTLVSNYLLRCPKLHKFLSPFFLMARKTAYPGCWYVQRELGIATKHKILNEISVVLSAIGPLDEARQQESKIHSEDRDPRIVSTGPSSETSQQGNEGGESVTVKNRNSVSPVDLMLPPQSPLLGHQLTTSTSMIQSKKINEMNSADSRISCTVANTSDCAPYIEIMPLEPVTQNQDSNGDYESYSYSQLLSSEHHQHTVTSETFSNQSFGVGGFFSPQICLKNLNLWLSGHRRKPSKHDLSLLKKLKLKPCMSLKDVPPCKLFFILRYLLLREEAFYGSDNQSTILRNLHELPKALGLVAENYNKIGSENGYMFEEVNIVNLLNPKTESLLPSNSLPSLPELVCQGLLGDEDPETLLQSVVFLMAAVFQLTVSELHGLTRSSIVIDRDEKGKYLCFSKDPQTSLNHVYLHGQTQEHAFTNTSFPSSPFKLYASRDHSKHCLVHLMSLYLDKTIPIEKSLFFQPRTDFYPHRWYNQQTVGKKWITSAINKVLNTASTDSLFEAVHMQSLEHGWRKLEACTLCAPYTTNYSSYDTDT